MLANAETKWAVLKAFNALIDHIANGRLNETMACFTADADVALFGSELSDTSLGPEAIRAHMAEIYTRPYRVLFDLQPGKVSAHGHVAWLTAEGTLRLSTDDERRPYRLSALMERRGGPLVVAAFRGFRTALRLSTGGIDSSGERSPLVCRIGHKENFPYEINILQARQFARARQKRLLARCDAE